MKSNRDFALLSAAIWMDKSSDTVVTRIARWLSRIHYLPCHYDSSDFICERIFMPMPIFFSKGQITICFTHLKLLFLLVINCWQETQSTWNWLLAWIGGNSWLNPPKKNPISLLIAYSEPFTIMVLTELVNQPDQT